MKLHSAPPIFLTLAWVFGTLFAPVTPPFQVPDEFHHFYRAYQVSEGHLTASKQGSDIGGYLPRSLAELKDNVSEQDLRGHPDRKQSLGRLWSMRKLKLNPHDRQFLIFGDVSWHAPLNYLPQAAAIALARGLRMGPLAILYAGRLGNLLVWSLLIYAALRLTPVLEWTLLLLAMMPMSLAQAASLSADATVNGVCFLFVAAVLRCAVADQRPIGRAALTGLTALGAAVALAKSAYIPLLLLFLMIPAAKFKSRRRYWLSFAAFAAVGVSVLAAWALCTYGTQSYVARGISPHDQAIYILHHPLRVLALEIGRLLKVPLLASIVGRFGWYDTKLYLPFVAVYAGVVIFITLRGGVPGVRITPRQKCLLAAAACGCWLMVFTLIYLVFSAVGGSSIEAVQGRYLIPIMPPVFLLLYPGPAAQRRNWARFMVMFSSLFSVYAVWVLVRRFYIA